MAKFIKGDIVVIDFPFSDLSATKKRPALVLATVSNQDLILCQITSKANKDNDAISLMTIDFKVGQLPVDSFIRPNKLFTADSNIISRKIGGINQKTLDATVSKIIEIITR